MRHTLPLGKVQKHLRESDGEVNNLTPLFESTGIKTDR